MAIELKNHFDYWNEALTHIDTPNDIAIQEFASGMAVDLAAITIGLSLRGLAQQYPQKHEAFRRDALSHIAQSLLMRHLFGMDNLEGDNIVLQDGRAVDQVPTIVPEPTYDNEQGMPLDLRVHVNAEVADLAIAPYDGSEPFSTWYRADNLFVRRVAPVKPTDAFRAHLIVENVSLDFSDMHTLVPYVAAQP